MATKSGKIYVTGMGIISSLGMGVADNLKSLAEGKTGIGKMNILETRLAGELIAGEISYPDEELVRKAHLADTKGISRGALLGVIAAREAVKDANFKDPDIRTGIISGTTAEAMTNIERYLKDFLSNDSKNEYIESQDWGFSTEVIARETGINGYMSTINTACSSAANAIMTGARMIKHGLLDRVLVGGTDALSKVMLNGFHALMIVDREVCKPFDKNRVGLNLGEGAAYLVIESEKTAQKDKILCEISGFGNSNEAYHLTALSPDGEGTAQAMHLALETGNPNPVDIDYINAHGTGSLNSDLSEALGLENVFGSNIPSFSSTKPFTGHTLGSAGALEAVFSILALQHNLIFPNLNFRQPMEEASVTPVTEFIGDREIRHVMSNSFGFGGNNTSLIFSKAGL